MSILKNNFLKHYNLYLRFACILLGMFLPFLLPFYCQSAKKEVKLWEEALRKWQYDFNVECLIPLDMYCKIQSICWTTSAKQIVFDF